MVSFWDHQIKRNHRASITSYINRNEGVFDPLDVDDFLTVWTPTRTTLDLIADWMFVGMCIINDLKPLSKQI